MSPFDFAYNFSGAEQDESQGADTIAANNRSEWTWRVTPAGGLLSLAWESERGPCAPTAAHLLVVRCTSASAVNVTASLTVE